MALPSNLLPYLIIDPSIEDDVLDALTILYDESPKIRALLDTVALPIQFQPGAGYLASGRTITVALSQIGTAGFVDERTGQTFAFSNIRAIAHELGHVLDGTSDWSSASEPSTFTIPGYDYVGNAVEFENDVMDEVNDGNHRASFTSGITVSELASLGAVLGQSLTDGQAVGTVVVDNSLFNKNHIDIHTTSATALLIGLGGNDTVVSGSGDDFVYGGDGNDILQGGAGNDKLFGNAGNDIFNEIVGHDTLNGGAGGDTSDFASAAESQRFVIAQDVHDPDAIGTFDADGPDFGLNGIGELIAIETIIGTEHDDVFEVVDIALTLQELDGGDGTDRLSFENTPTGITIEAGSLNASVVWLDTNSFNIKGFEQVFGTTYDDSIDLSTSDDDLVLMGGTGGDSVLGGSGNDILVDETYLYTSEHQISLPFGSGVSSDYLAGGMGNDTYGVMSKYQVLSSVTEDWADGRLLSDDNFSLSSTWWSNATTIEDEDGMNNLLISASVFVSAGWLWNEDLSVNVAYEMPIGVSLARSDPNGLVDAGGFKFGYANIGNFYSSAYQYEETLFLEDGQVDVYQSYAAVMSGDDLYLWVNSVLDGSGYTGSVGAPIAIIKNYEGGSFDFGLA